YLVATNANKTFIAPDVATNEDFEKAQRAGFTLFQGYFFSQPVVTKKEKDIEPLKVNYFRLLQITSTDDFVDFNEISDIISSDVALSYKLLRLLNSAMVGLRTRVSSILMAITYLGEESLKQWIAVLALRGIADEKPLELVRLSLIRARFGEL
ncbi:MAG: HDOD domain-containing protein, partial [Oscillospiraceae bacterium]